MDDKRLPVNVFDDPVLVTPSAWVEHTSYAFYLISALRPKVFVELGVHTGHSYNAFCQAVDSCSTGTRCYGVDTWKGDEHTGPYEEEIYNALQRHQDQHYSTFSYLLRKTFDQALVQFSDGSIDLLHIDGMHTYEAVRHDFEAWLPKMSPRGVVVFHDTMERQTDFGVWKLWEEVAAKYPSFTFTHGHGLGTIAVGSEVPKEFLEFLNDAKSGPFHQRLFAALGKRSTLEMHIQERDRAAKAAADTAWHQIQQLTQQVGRVEAARSDAQRKFAEAKELQEQNVREQAEKSAALVLHKDQQVAQLHQQVGELDGALAKIHGSRGWKLLVTSYRVARLARRVVGKLLGRRPPPASPSVQPQGGEPAAPTPPAPEQPAPAVTAAVSGDWRKQYEHTALQHTAALPVFKLPGSSKPRVNLVTDSVNSGSMFGGVATSILLAAQLADARQARLRIITRTEPAQEANVAEILKHNGMSSEVREVDFVFAPLDGSVQVDVGDGDFFLTTSWWTTRSTLASVKPAQVLYLLQEDERMFYAFGDERLQCEQALRDPRIRYVVNSRLLFDHMVADGFTGLRERGTWFEPAFSKSVFYSTPPNGAQKHRLFFYARPGHPRNLFYFGMEVLEEAVLRGVLDTNAWEVVLCGKDIPPDLTLRNGYRPTVQEKLGFADYAEFIRSVDLGLCLMYTPHPSYPPLDLAASGAVVVTNRYGNKQDLNSYSRNIICAELDRDALVVAIGEGIKLALNTPVRLANYESSGLGRDWKQNLSKVVEFAGRTRRGR